MRLYTGKKRLAKKLNKPIFGKDEHSKWFQEVARYLLQAKPGDIVHTCTGYNHRVREIEVIWDDGQHWRVSGRRNSRTKVLREIRVTDDEGRWHHFPGGGCVSLPETQEEIDEYHRGWDDPEGWETIEDWKASKLAEDILKLRRGEHCVDKNGFRISNTDLGLPFEELVELIKSSGSSSKPDGDVQ